MIFKSSLRELESPSCSSLAGLFPLDHSAVTRKMAAVAELLDIILIVVFQRTADSQACSAGLAGGAAAADTDKDIADPIDRHPFRLAIKRYEAWERGFIALSLDRRGQCKNKDGDDSNCAQASGSFCFHGLFLSLWFSWLIILFTIFDLY